MNTRVIVTEQPSGISRVILALRLTVVFCAGLTSLPTLGSTNFMSQLYLPRTRAWLTPHLACLETSSKRRSQGRPSLSSSPLLTTRMLQPTNSNKRNLCALSTKLPVPVAVRWRPPQFEMHARLRGSSGFKSLPFAGAEGRWVLESVCAEAAAGGKHRNAI